MTISFATEGLLLAAACSIFPPPEKRGTASQENLKILAAHTGEGSVAVGHRTERFSFCAVRRRRLFRSQPVRFPVDVCLLLAS